MRIAERLVAVGPNETARQDVLTGRSSSESVSIRYAYWRDWVSNTVPITDRLAYLQAALPRATRRRPVFWVWADRA